MLELRDYQSEAIESMRRNFKNGHKRQVLICPTGGGKSITMLSMMSSVIELNKKCIFICERRNLVDQFSAHLDNYRIEHGILMAGTSRWNPDANIQVASIQTIEKMDSIPRFDLFFLDELHAIMRKSVISIIDNNPDQKIIGATATPFNPKIGKYFTAISKNIPMVDLVDKKHLVPFRVFASTEVDTNGVKVSSDGEWAKGELGERGKKIIGNVILDYGRISTEVFGGKVKTICFSASIAHGKALAEEFNNNGVMAIQLASGVNEEYKNNVLKEFNEPGSMIDVLISVDMLSRGFDQTDIKHVILARPIKKSFSTFVQQIGRGARSHTDKNFCVIQDHGSNWLRFEDDWSDLYHNGVTSLISERDKATKKEPTEQEKKEAKCPECGCISPGEVCANCGYTRERKNLAETVDGKMSELNVETKKATKQDKQEWLSMFNYFRDENNYQKGWSAHKYKDKFGVWPKGLNDIQRIKPNKEFTKWMRHLSIKHNKRPS